MAKTIRWTPELSRAAAAYLNGGEHQNQPVRAALDERRAIQQAPTFSALPAELQAKIRLHA